MTDRKILGKRVALISALIVLMGLAPIIVSSTMVLKKESLERELLVGVYWDSDCGSPVSSLYFDSIETGSSKDVVVYIRNEGNSPIALYLEATNWEPEAASDYITLRWDYAGQQISPDEVIQVTLKLSVSSSIDEITSFGFDIVISYA